MTEENHMGWKLVSGVRKDVINLFKLFASTNSVRFDDFSKVWKEMEFSHIFSNRTTVVELLEFTEEVLQIIKEYLSSVFEFHTRVAALYTLYGIYFKQPLRGAAKIRFTKTEWQDVFSLIEFSKTERHYDVVFIYMKLYLYGAYTFVATVRPGGLERGYRKYSEKRSSLISKACDVELMYRPLVSERLVKSLVKLESLYCRKKSELLGKKNLVFIDGKFAESLLEELKDYASASQTKTSVKDKSSVIVEKANDDNDDDDDDDDDDYDYDESPSESREGKTPGKKGKTSKHKSSRVEGSSKPSPDDEDEEDLTFKKTKFGKKYLNLIAKKKAEYYIKKIHGHRLPPKKSIRLEDLLRENEFESQENI